MRADLHLAAMVLLLATAGPALAQPKDPGNDTTSSYTPVTGTASALFPTNPIPASLPMQS